MVSMTMVLNGIGVSKKYSASAAESGGCNAVF